jgi:hypothetical protein
MLRTNLLYRNSASIAGFPVGDICLVTVLVVQYFIIHKHRAYLRYTTVIRPLYDRYLSDIGQILDICDQSLFISKS